jgi:hypothetical protein
MWPRLILRELIPLLPRLLRLLPALEGFFLADRTAQSAARAETTRQMIADLQEQLREDTSERRRLLLELQAKIESSQQDLQITVTQLAALEQQTRQLAHQVRLLAICTVGIAVAALASMIIVAVLFARTWH